MKQLLNRLKKAVDKALDVHAPTQDIELSDFPAYVVKSLEVILADKDADRVAHRLTALRSKVEEASGLAKQSVGSAEDTESQRINVTVFEEPALSARPKVESETSPEAAGGMIGKALEDLRKEVTELKRLVGKDMHPGSDDEEDDKKKAKGKDEEADSKKAKGEEEDDSQKAKGKDEEADSDKAKGEEDDEEKKADVTKSVNWPLDMNSTMPGAESVQKRHPELDWGQDPHGAEAQ